MPLVTQRVVSHLLDTIDYDKQIAKVARVYQEKWKVMKDTYDQYGSSKVTFTNPTGGMFVWMTMPDGVDSKAFFEDCMQHKVGIVPGAAFATDGSLTSQSFRLSYTFPDVESIRTGMEVVAKLTRAYC